MLDTCPSVRHVRGNRDTNRTNKQAVSADGAQRTLYFFSSSTIRWKLLDLSKSSVLRSISAMAALGMAPTPYGENRMSMVAATRVTGS
jgi:hypothetical protein